MASQPLETIPEEPTPAPTPPNSPTPATPTPTPARVTADPPQTKPSKNPGRVASGKRLAERNRLARKAKKQAQAEAASTASASNTTASANNTTTATASDSNSVSLVTVLGIVGLIVSALGVYYQREAIRARFNPAPPAQPAPARSRIPVKRGIKEME